MPTGEDQSQALEFDSAAPWVVECRCQFCGRLFWIDPARLLLAHELPYCPEFGAMDVVSFMAENRRRAESRRVRA